jgi:hypothetical protein
MNDLLTDAKPLQSRLTFVNLIALALIEHGDS